MGSENVNARAASTAICEAAMPGYQFRPRGLFLARTSLLSVTSPAGVRSFTTHRCKSPGVRPSFHADISLGLGVAARLNWQLPGALPYDAEGKTWPVMFLATKTFSTRYDTPS